LEVADNNYDYEVSQKIFIKQAVNNFLDLIKSDKKGPDIKIQTGNSVMLFFDLTDNTEVNDFQESAAIDVLDYTIVNNMAYANNP